MVSEKTIIVLITLAILLSAVSVVVTVSTLNSADLPEVRNVEYSLPDQEPGQVGLSIVNPNGGAQ